MDKPCLYPWAQDTWGFLRLWIYIFTDEEVPLSSKRWQVLIWFLLHLCVHRKYLKQYCVQKDCWKGHIQCGNCEDRCSVGKGQVYGHIGVGGLWSSLSLRVQKCSVPGRQQSRVGSHRRTHSALKIALAAPPCEPWGFVVVLSL